MPLGRGRHSRPYGKMRMTADRSSPRWPPAPSRRQLLWQTGGGLGGIALAHLLGQSGLLAADAHVATPTRADLNGGLHHRAKAKRVIQLFMNGGVSQCDTFDYKPQLERRHG